MYRILDRIDDTAAQFSAHPFFERLLDEPPRQAVQAIAPHLSFWTGAYLDLLRLSEPRVQTPALRRLVARRAAQAGSSPWLVPELRSGATALSARPLFAPERAPIRDGAYAVLAEVFHAQGDTELIALHLALDAHARVLDERLHLFFGHAPAHPPRPHRSIDAADSILADLAPRRDAKDRARTLVSRAHRALAGMFDGVLAVLEEETARVLGNTHAA